MKSRQSNLHYFFLFLLTLIGFSSCSKDTDLDKIVPYSRVQFEYLDNENKLGAVGNSIYLNEDDITTSSAGYKNHGIILVKLSEGYAAFDATCTNDVESEEHVEIDGAFAICPVCDSKFNILQGGFPFAGSAARYQLKVYNTSSTSEGNHATIRVRN
jgi:nitrite reductase/ring-hydroxylating ferredoxin subunit